MSAPIRFQIVCGSGVLVTGANHDFLGCILLAKRYKQRFQSYLPHSHLRVHFFYPNRQRVSPGDIKAALRALDSKTVALAVDMRVSKAVAIPPARSEARTAGVATESVLNLAVEVASDFCQAGVVAPPDSPDLGNSLVARIDGLGS